MRIEFTDISIDGLRSVFSENKIFNGHLKITLNVPILQNRMVERK